MSWLSLNNKQSARRFIRIWIEHYNGAIILWLGCSDNKRLRMLGGVPLGKNQWQWIGCPSRLYCRINKLLPAMLASIGYKYYEDSYVY